MSFSKLSKHKEIAIIASLLTIFITVKEVQLRKLFEHLSNEEYGRIMSRLRLEGLAYRSPDARYVASSKYAYQQSNCEEHALCFDAFLLIKDQLQDFCAGSFPTLITVATVDCDYDIIPATKSTIQAVNAALDDIPDRTVRYLVLDDMTLANHLCLRLSNDFILCDVAGKGLKAFTQKRSR